VRTAPARAPRQGVSAQDGDHLRGGRQSWAPQLQRRRTMCFTRACVLCEAAGQEAGHTRRRRHVPPEFASVAREEVVHNRGDGQVRAELDRIDLEGGPMRVLQGASDRRRPGAGTHEARAHAEAPKRRTPEHSHLYMQGRQLLVVRPDQKFATHKRWSLATGPLLPMNDINGAYHSPVSAKMRMICQRGA
jgi:hypothetical protein